MRAPAMADRRRVSLGALASLTACAVPAKDGAPDPFARAAAIRRAIRQPQIGPQRMRLAPTPGDARVRLQAAIEAAADSGGGRIILESGLWACAGPLHLRSGVELHLAQGAHLRFEPDPALYLPVVLTRWEGTEVYNYSPMIYARDGADIAITGAGVIDGQGEAHWLPWRARQRPDQSRLRDMGRDGVAVEERRFGAGHFLRPPLIQFFNCARVRVEGVRLQDSPFWCLHPVYCQDVTVRRIRVVSRHVNSDGVDPDSCERVLIEQCDFDVGDDGVSIKAGRDQDGWRVGRPCRNIVVRQCRYQGKAGGGFAIGSEMSGGVSDIYVDGLSIPEASHALYFKANLDRGGEIRDVFIRDVRAGAVESFIILTNDYHSYRGGDFPPRFEGIEISDSFCTRAKIGLHATGHPRAPVQRVRLRGIEIGAAVRPIQVADIAGFHLDNVRINGEAVAEAVPIDRSAFLDFKR